jgi:hypothetical protein
MLVLATLLLVLIALLAVPIRIRFRVGWDAGWQRDIQLDWGFGVLRFRTQAEQTREAAASAGEAVDDARSHRRRGRSRPRVLAALRDGGFRRRVIRFVAASWRALHTRDLYARVRVGLGDPADTGMLWGVLGPVASLARASRWPVWVEPDFADATFELESRGTIRVVPLEIVFLVVALVLSPAFWRGVRVLRRVEA